MERNRTPRRIRSRRRPRAYSVTGCRPAPRDHRASRSSLREFTRPFRWKPLVFGQIRVVGVETTQIRSSSATRSATAISSSTPRSSAGATSLTGLPPRRVTPSLRRTRQPLCRHHSGQQNHRLGRNAVSSARTFDKTAQLVVMVVPTSNLAEPGVSSYQSFRHPTLVPSDPNRFRT